jgi:hypothetical protein
MRLRHLACTIGLAALAACLTSCATPPGAPAPADGGNGGAGTARVEDAPLELRLDALDAPRPRRTVAERNPFEFAAPTGADAVGAGAPAAPELSRAGGAAADLQPAAREVAAPQPGLRFIAVVDAPQSAGFIAVLTDGDTVFHGRVGDTVDGRYRIMSIGADSAEIALLQTGERQILNLDGS